MPPDEVTRDQRRAAKMVNFGIAYGLSPHGLSTRPGHPQRGGARHHRALLRRATPASAATWRRRSSKARETRLRGDALRPAAARCRTCSRATAQVAQAAERAAINMPIQGTAADLIKLAMLEVDEAARASEGCAARMLLQVHDELLFEAPDAEVEQVKALARECMSSVASCKVPLKVDVGAGKKWAERPHDPLARAKKTGREVPDPAGTSFRETPPQSTDCESTADPSDRRGGADPIHASQRPSWRLNQPPCWEHTPFRAMQTPPARGRPYSFVFCIFLSRSVRSRTGLYIALELELPPSGASAGSNLRGVRVDSSNENLLESYPRPRPSAPPGGAAVLTAGPTASASRCCG